MKTIRSPTHSNQLATTMMSSRKQRYSKKGKFLFIPPQARTNRLSQPFGKHCSLPVDEIICICLNSSLPLANCLSPLTVGCSFSFSPAFFFFF